MQDVSIRLRFQGKSESLWFLNALWRLIRLAFLPGRRHHVVVLRHRRSFDVRYAVMGILESTVFIDGITVLIVTGRCTATFALGALGAFGLGGVNDIPDGGTARARFGGRSLGCRPTLLGGAR